MSINVSIRKLNIRKISIFILAVIPENIHKGSSIINITATDPDDGLGGDIKYEILDEGDANGRTIVYFQKYILYNFN